MDTEDERKNKLAQASDFSEIIRKVRLRTPARLLEGRSGASYRTNTQLKLR
jgi:ethanolamine ammonia-lyase small subunit